MTHPGKSLLLGLLIAGVLAVAAPGQTGEIRIKGNNRDETITPRPTPKAPQSKGVSVISAEFGDEAGAAAQQKAPAVVQPDGILVYATEYFTRQDERRLKTSLPAGARSSEIHYGTGEPRSEIHYGTGEPRSEIRYGSGEQRSEIRYGTGEPRSEIRYGTGEPRSEISYGGTTR